VKLGQETDQVLQTALTRGRREQSHPSPCRSSAKMPAAKRATDVRHQQQISDPNAREEALGRLSWRTRPFPDQSSF
jgi:hypothetical protein